MKIEHAHGRSIKIEDVSLGVPVRFKQQFHQDKCPDGPWIRIKAQCQPAKPREANTHVCVVNVLTGDSSWVEKTREVVILNAHVVHKGDLS
jgi:hypothetical protein